MPSGVGLLLFVLYTAAVIAIAQQHGFSVHSYADDTKLYFHDQAVSCDRRTTDRATSASSVKGVSVSYPRRQDDS